MRTELERQCRYALEEKGARDMWGLTAEERNEDLCIVISVQTHNFQKGKIMIHKNLK